jgi:hypothetical protein
MVDVETPEGTARTILEVVAVVLVFGAMAVWVRSNRVALDLGREGGGVASLYPVRVVGGPQGRPVRAARPTAGHAAAAPRVERDALAASTRDVGTRG